MLVFAGVDSGGVFYQLSQKNNEKKKQLRPRSTPRKEKYRKLSLVKMQCG